MSDEPKRRGFFGRLRAGLSRSTERLTGGITAVFTARRRLDDDVLEELEEILIMADLGPSTAAKLTANLAKTRFNKEVSDQEVREAFAEDIASMLEPVAHPLVPDPARKPHVVLVVGVNGVGKTTTIGKLAQQYRAEGKSVVMAAGDTFRAAAVEQLQVWAERTGAGFVSGKTGSDAAGLAYGALEQAQAVGADVLLIDTAGRLHNKDNLMAELQKIARVIKKVDPEAPHDTVLVLDATTGQNAHAQVETFQSMANITGLIVTKLDGTARGGVLVALAEKFGLPVHAIGVGESAEDMRPFHPEDFARSLMGLNREEAAEAAELAPAAPAIDLVPEVPEPEPVPALEMEPAPEIVQEPELEPEPETLTEPPDHEPVAAASGEDATVEEAPGEEAPSDEAPGEEAPSAAEEQSTDAEQPKRKRGLFGLRW